MTFDFFGRQSIMRIILTVPSCLPDYGGPAFLVTRLAAGLELLGAHVSLWASDGSAPATPLLPRTSAVRRLAGRLSETLDKVGKFDVLHDHGIWLPHNHMLASFADANNVPRVVSTHGMLDPWCLNHRRWKKRLAWRLYQKTDLMRAAVHHVTSDAEAKNIANLNMGVPISVIPIGIDLPADQHVVRNGPRKETRNAVYLGRIHPVKGLPMLIEAWARVRPSKWELRVAGPDCDGHQREVEDLVNKNGLAELVSFVGPLSGSEKQSFLQKADLFILPSHSESFGVAVAEALSYQVPVLTTTAAPWPVLQAEGCGWSVLPTADALAEGLRLATSRDPEKLTAMGARGRAWVQMHLGWDRVLHQFLNVYEALIR